MGPTSLSSVSGETAAGAPVSAAGACANENVADDMAQTDSMAATIAWTTARASLGF
jgi:hypothetical protein